MRGLSNASIPGAPWTCPNCAASILTSFCPGCGERQLRPLDLTLRGLLIQLLRGFTRIDGRVIRTLDLLVRRPGSLTAAFSQGRRKPFLGPLQLFVLSNLLFFTVQSFTDVKIFSGTLAFRLDDELWSNFATTLVNRHLENSGLTLAQYSPLFDQAVALHAKSMIGLMVPAFALMSALILLRMRRPAVIHMIFALHFYAFLLLVFCVPLGAVIMSVLCGGSDALGPRSDAAISMILLGVCGLYLYVSLACVYGARGFGRIVQTLLLTITAAVIFVGYKFVLLPITLYLT